MSDMGMNIDQPTFGGVSRRRVLQGAAWSVPAVMVAQLPSWASGGTPVPVTVTVVGDVCKFPGQSNELPFGYAFSLELTNGSPTTSVDVTIDSMQVDDNVNNTIVYVIAVDDVNQPVCTNETPDKTVTVPGGETVRLAVFVEGEDNSNSGDVSVGYTWTGPDGSESAVASTGFTGSSWSGQGQGTCRPFGISVSDWSGSTCGAIVN